MSEQFVVERIEEPPSEAERELLAIIDAIRRDYEKQIAPYVKALADIEATRATTGYYLRIEP